jgi:hypothetical protein
MADCIESLNAMANEILVMPALGSLDVHPEETCHDNYYDDDANDIEDTHCIPFRYS